MPGDVETGGAGALGETVRGAGSENDGDAIGGDKGWDRPTVRVGPERYERAASLSSAEFKSPTSTSCIRSFSSSAAIMLSRRSS